MRTPRQLWRAWHCSLAGHWWASEMPSQWVCRHVNCCRCGVGKTIHATVPMTHGYPTTGCHHVDAHGITLAGSTTFTKDNRYAVSPPTTADRD